MVGVGTSVGHPAQPPCRRRVTKSSIKHFTRDPAQNSIKKTTKALHALPGSPQAASALSHAAIAPAPLSDRVFAAPSLLRYRAFGPHKENRPTAATGLECQSPSISDPTQTQGLPPRVSTVLQQQPRANPPT